MNYKLKIGEYSKNFYKFLEDFKKENPESYFFSKDTLHFFGESLTDMKILPNIQNIKSSSGEAVECFVLSKKSKNWNNKRIQNDAYFSTENLKRIIKD